jgi:8-oxo-dGTP diphosphatase
MIKRYGRSPKPGISYRRRLGVYGVLFDGAQVLLTHQQDPTPEYQLPGGGVDPGEAPIAALHREVMEETGWRIGPPRWLGTYRRFTYMPEYGFHAEKLCVIFLARPILRIGPPSEPGHTAVWASPDAAAQILANDGDRAMLIRAVGYIRKSGQKRHP